MDFLGLDIGYFSLSLYFQTLLHSRKIIIDENSYWQSLSKVVSKVMIFINIITLTGNI